MLTVNIEGVDKSLAVFDRLQTGFARTVRQAVLSAAIMVTAKVKDEKLSGQVLNVRSGRLRRSINYRVVSDGDAMVDARVGTNVEYAPIHEFGFDGDQKVRAHMRKGRPVVAHTRHVKLPERSFLRSTLREEKDHIDQMIASALVRSIASRGAE